VADSIRATQPAAAFLARGKKRLLGGKSDNNSTVSMLSNCGSALRIGSCSFDTSGELLDLLAQGDMSSGSAGIRVRFD
jgi:hypothetical protein